MPCRFRQRCNDERVKLGIWKAFCRDTDQLIDWKCGARDQATLRRLLDRLKDWNIWFFFTDNWKAYSLEIDKNDLFQGKSGTVAIERNKKRQRHWFARFRRKSIVVSKSVRMVELAKVICTNLEALRAAMAEPGDENRELVLRYVDASLESPLDLSVRALIRLVDCRFGRVFDDGPVLKIGPAARVIISDVAFQGNTSALTPFVINYGCLETYDVEFKDHQGLSCFGGAVLNLGRWRAEHLSVRNSRAEYGGGIFNLGGRFQARDLRMRNNQAEFGGALINRNGRLEIRESEIEANKARQRGRAFYSSGGLAELNSGKIFDNEAAESGGGLANEEGGRVILEDIKLTQNKTEAQKLFRPDPLPPDGRSGTLHCL